MGDEWETQQVLARYYDIEEIKKVVRKKYKDHTDADFDFKTNNDHHQWKVPKLIPTVIIAYLVLKVIPDHLLIGPHRKISTGMEAAWDLEECFEKSSKDRGIGLRQIGFRKSNREECVKPLDKSSRWPAPDDDANDNDNLNHELQNNESIKIYSIHQTGSHNPLDAPLEDFHALVKTEGISEEIYPLTQNFCERDLQTEEAFVSPSFQVYSSKDVEFGYVFKYPEPRNRSKEGAQWSIRQTGVYCKTPIGPGGCNKSTWLLLHPIVNPGAKERLNSALDDPRRAVLLLKKPIEMHKLVLESYFRNWRPYLRHVEEDLVRLNMPLLADPDEMSDVIRTQKLVRIRYLENLVQPSIAIFASMLRVLDSISDLYPETAEGEGAILEAKSQIDPVHNLKQQVHSFAAYAQFLLRRLSSTAQLFSDGLALKNHRTVQRQSEELARMTHATTQDSATIRVITAVTVVFLPTTSVATLFGTEVLYLTDDHKLQASPQIWIFVVASVALTLLTIVFWRLRKWGYEQERKRLSSPLEPCDIEKAERLDGKESTATRIFRQLWTSGKD